MLDLLWIKSLNSFYGIGTNVTYDKVTKWLIKSNEFLFDRVI